MSMVLKAREAREGGQQWAQHSRWRNSISKGTEAEKDGSCSGPCLQLLLIHSEFSRETESKHLKNLNSNLKE